MSNRQVVVQKALFSIKWDIVEPEFHDIEQKHSRIKLRAEESWHLFTQFVWIV